MQTLKLDIYEQPFDDAAYADAGISRLRLLSMKLAMAELDIKIFDAMEPIEAEWRTLERDPLNSLHQGYDFCTAWVSAHRRPLAILWGTCNGKTAFILPLEITKSRGQRVARFIGAAHSNINTGLFSKSAAEVADNIDPEHFVAQLRRALRGRADLLLLQNLPLEWRGRKSPLATLPMVQNQNHAYQLPLLESFDATLTQLNTKSRRKKFRTQLQRMEALGGSDYVVPESFEEQHRFLDIFFAQKRGRFAALGLPDVFADTEIRAFLHSLIELRSGDGRDFGLQMHAIRLKGEHEGHLAALCGISRKADHVICQFGSIDESLAADASPGEFLYWQVISGLNAQKVALFDFGLGDQSYKRSWAPEETAHYDVVLPISALGFVAGTAHRLVTRGKAQIKAHPGLYRLTQRLRTKLG